MISEITKTSPQGVEIVYIDAPGLARADFSPKHAIAHGLETRIVPATELTDAERRAFGIEGGAQ